MSNDHSSKTTFINALAPSALGVAQQIGVDPRIIIAQAALETNWGASAPRNNYFGIKSHNTPGGQTLTTHEVINGKPVSITDNFRAYDSLEDSVQDYGNFLASNGRYRPLLQARGLNNQLNALQNTGYATDPNYSKKVGQIAHSLTVDDDGALAYAPKRKAGAAENAINSILSTSNSNQPNMSNMRYMREWTGNGEPPDDVFIDSSGQYAGLFNQTANALPDGQIKNEAQNADNQASLNLPKGVYQDEEADYLTGEFNKQDKDRFVAIPADQVDKWQEDWKKDNQSQGLLGDIVPMLKIGAADTMEAIDQVLFSLPGVGDKIKKGADWLDTSINGQTSQEGLDKYREHLASTLSDKTQEARNKDWLTDDYKPGPAWADPHAYAALALNSVPGTAASMVVPGLLFRSVGLKALANGATKAAAATAATRAATIGGGISEAFLTGGSTAAAIEQEFNKTPKSVFEDSDAVQSLVDQGMSFDDAVNSIKSDAKTQGLLLGGLAGGAFGGQGDRILAKIISEKIGGGVKRRALRGMLKGTAAEGILEEMPQEAGQQMAQNKAMQTIDPDRPIMEGVPNAAAGGLAIGGLMGGSMGGVAGVASPKGPIRNAVDEGTKDVQLQAEQADSTISNQPAAKQAGDSTERSNLPIGAQVRIAADGLEPQYGKVTGGAGGFVDITDPETGEIYQAPVSAVTPVEPNSSEAAPADLALPNANDGIPIAKTAGNTQDSIPVEQEGRDAIETNSGPVAKQKQKAVADLSRAPQAGSNVIVEMPDGNRQVAKLLEWGDNEARVRLKNDDELAVPTTKLFVDGRPDKDIADEDAKLNPPVEREPVKSPLARNLFGHTVLLPDDAHSRLFDLGLARKADMKMYGSTALQLNQNPPSEQIALAKAFKVTPEAAGQMADHYQHIVERAAREARSDLPVHVSKFGGKRLQQMQRAYERANDIFAQQPMIGENIPEVVLPKQWADMDLTARKDILSRAKVKRSPKFGWNDFSQGIQRKLANVMLDKGATVPVEDSDVISKAAETANGTSEQKTEQSKTTPTATNAQEKPAKWFGSLKKAKEYIAENGLKDTHQIVKNKRRYEIHEKHDNAVETKQPKPVVANAQDKVSKTQGAENATEEHVAHNTEKTDVEDTQSEKPAKVVVSKNTIFTDDAAEKARKILRSKLSQLNVGIDPEIMQAGIVLAGYHIEKGARTFAAYAKAMIGDMGDIVKPYLKSWYMGVKYDPRAADFAGMSDVSEVDKADIDAILSTKTSQAQNQLDLSGKNDEQLTERQLPDGKPEARNVAALERIPSENAENIAGKRTTGERTPNPDRNDAVGDGEARGQRVHTRRSMADGAGELSDTPGGGRGNGGLGKGTSDAARIAEVSGTRSEDARSGRLEPASNALPAGEQPADYTISEQDHLGEGGAKTKFKANVAAIKVLRNLDREKRIAKRQEQTVLSKWVGWGGLRNAFPREDGSSTKGWEKEVAELKTLLTPEEYKAAQSSTRNAFFTAPDIVNAMWSIAERLGFKGGQVLEPSVGVGNIIGLMPPTRREQSAITGVELDNITGSIAKNLYPKANIQAPVAFQNFETPDNFFDLVIGNPPFGPERLYDAKRKHLNNFSIHNYFFAKSIDALRPGGTAIMVVTNAFLDGNRDAARQYIAGKADLIGAIRLPNDAFLKNAGTQVTSDIIVLRKRADGDLPSDQSWLETVDWKDANGKVVPLNKYFAEHPEQMLGEFGAFGGMYRGDAAALIKREGDDLPKLLEKAIDTFPSNIMPSPQKIVKHEEVKVSDNADDALVGSYFADKNGEIQLRLPDYLGKVQTEPVKFSNEKAKERVQGLVRIRDAFARLRAAQIDADASDEKVENLRARLNKVYDAFVKKNGPVHATSNYRLMRDDPTWPQLAALEEKYDKGISKDIAKKTGEEPREPSAKKAAIFSVRTQQPWHKPTGAKTAKDALALTLADIGHVDIDAIRRLYNKPGPEIINELGDLIYKTPTGSYQTSDEYLTGNVRKKLVEAENAAKTDPSFLTNVSALKNVIPPDIEAVDISVKPGAPWVPINHVADFVHKIADSDSARVFLEKYQSKWMINNVNPSLTAQSKWSTNRTSTKDIILAALNGSTITVRDKINRDTTVVNQEATDAANQKVENLKREWDNWIWTDDKRRQELTRLYNDTFNTNVLRHYDGSHLQLPGKVGDDVISLRPHQKNFVWRVLQSGTTLADHTVGAGKTFALIASVMEMRRMGRANKPMVVVPNHLVGQWAADFVKLYPGAKILAATKRDFEKNHRKQFFARVATGDWDAIIVAHSSFGKIGVSPAFEGRFIENEIDKVVEALEAAKQAGDRSRNVSQLAKHRDSLRERLKKLADTGAKDEGLNFMDLGVDALIVDEAHEFKNLAFSSSMQRVAGLGNQQGSNKAFDLFMKSRYVLEQTGGRNIIFATGTPISNTMAEMYTMQRYLDPEGLRDLGVENFDAWAKVFGEVVTDWELSPAGSYKLNSRFAKFVNMPELMQRYRHFADVITNDDIKKQLAERGEKLPLPKVKGGKPQNIVVDRSPDQAKYIESLVKRSENLPKRPIKGGDNMLKIMSDARKAALDMRLIDPMAPDYKGSKVNCAADNITRLYKKWNAQKGTQLVFIDLSTPGKARTKEADHIKELVAKSEAGDEAAQAALEKVSPDEIDALSSKFSVYDDLKEKLIKRGIPSDEIAFIHDANTDVQKEELFGKVRSGAIRVLFGSTPKMGAGTNVQNRLVALHHLDAPWRPSDLEQRDGRGIRQGNELYNADPEGFEIEILRYATKNTLDARQWQTIEAKARFVQQVRKGDLKTREIDDIGGEAANAAEMKAAASGNPLILEEMDLRKQLRKLEGLSREHQREQNRIKDTISHMNAEIKAAQKSVPLAETDADKVAHSPKAFEAKIGDQTITKMKEAGAAIIAKGRALDASKEQTENIGSYCGLDIFLDKNSNIYNQNAMVLRLEGANTYEIDIPDITKADPTGLAVKMSNRVASIKNEPEGLKKLIRFNEKQIDGLEKQKAPFEFADELEKTRARHAEVINLLKPKEKTSADEGATGGKDADKASIGNASGNKLSKAGLLNELRQGSVGKFIGSLLDNGFLEIADNAHDAPKSAQAWTGPDGKIHLIANRINVSDAQAVLLHEAFHSGARKLIGNAKWQNLMGELSKLYKQFSKSRGNAGKFFEAAQNRVEQAGGLIGAGDAMVAEEFGAYAIEEYERAPNALTRWADNLLGRVKAWIFQKFGRQIGKVTPAQLRSIAIAALADNARQSRVNDRQLPRGAVKYSIIPDTQVLKNGVSVPRIIENLKGRLTDLQPAVLKTIPLNYFTELAQPNMTAVGDYLRVKRELDAYRGKKHEEADAIAQRWLKFSRLGKEKVQQLSALMHEATLAGIDPAKTDKGTQAKTGYDRLRKAFTSLPISGQQLYCDVRDAYAKQSKELDNIIMDNVKRVEEIAQERADNEFSEEKDKIERSSLDPLGKRQAIEELEKVYKIKRQRSAWALKARLMKLRQVFEANRVDGPYFPLARFGQYYVTVKNRDGEVISFSRREHAADRDRLAKEMKREYPNATVETGILEQGKTPRDAIDPRIIAEFETILGKSALSTGEAGTVMDQIWQRYLQMMPDLSVRKRFIHRKGTAGFDADALRAFSSHMFHAGHQMGRLKYGIDLEEYVNKANDQAKKADDTTRAQMLANELRSRHGWVMNPTGSKFAQTMTSAAFVWYLSTSPAAAIVNMSQTPMLGIPVLAARFGSFTKAAGAILRAAKDTVVGRGSVENADLTPDEREALKAFNDSGLIDRTQSHDLAGVGETGVEYSPLRAKVMRIISWAFHRAEVWNREVTALASYRMARDAGQDAKSAIDTAHELTWKTHFDYSNSSRPAIMQNDFAKVALVFRTYNINMMYRIFRDLHQAFRGKTKEARREARTQLVGVLGMMGLMAGTTGIFGFNLAMSLLGAAFGDDDDPYDFSERYKAAVIEMLGPELGGVLLNGVPGHYLGIDLTGRIGMPDIWFRSPNRDLQGKDEYDYWVMNALGANVSMLGDAWRGIEMVKDGNVARGVEALAPKWARDLMKSWRYYDEGLTNIKGDQVLNRNDVDAWDIIAQAVGFTPAKITETWERNNALKNAEQRIVDTRRSLINAWAMAVASKDKDAVKDALEAIKRFNKVPRNRAVAITNDTLSRSFRQRQTLARKKEDGVLINNQRLGIGLRKELPAAIYR